MHCWTTRSCGNLAKCTEKWVLNEPQKVVDTAADHKFSVVEAILAKNHKVPVM
jgi:hypothetical protein